MLYWLLHLGLNSVAGFVGCFHALVGCTVSMVVVGFGHFPQYKRDTAPYDDWSLVEHCFVHYTVERGWGGVFSCMQIHVWFKSLLLCRHGWLLVWSKCLFLVFIVVNRGTVLMQVTCYHWYGMSIFKYLILTFVAPIRSNVYPGKKGFRHNLPKFLCLSAWLA